MRGVLPSVLDQTRRMSIDLQPKTKQVKVSTSLFQKKNAEGESNLVAALASEHVLALPSLSMLPNNLRIQNLSVFCVPRLEDHFARRR